jgi:hypothetical protein
MTIVSAGSSRFVATCDAAMPIGANSFGAVGDAST